MLDLLPDDRRLPIHIDKAMDREERMKLQEAPWDWGSYKDPIDGVLGAQSTVAPKTFFRERGSKMLAMSKTTVTERCDENSKSGIG
jgi:hypothetical protein